MQVRQLLPCPHPYPDSARPLMLWKGSLLCPQHPESGHKGEKCPEWGQGKGQKLLLSETIIWGRYLSCSKSLKKHWHVNQNQPKNWWSKGMMKIQNIIALTAQHRIPLPLPPTPKNMINWKDNSEGREELQQWCRCLRLCVYIHTHTYNRCY